jgi:threonyl-tRNA synthetase
MTPRTGHGESTMPVITLPDGNTKQFEQAVSVIEVAAAIGAGLAKAALGGLVDGRAVDISHLIESDCALSILTAKDAAGLEIIRHSTAHLLAQAVKQLFPAAQVTIGPVIDDGFYYDFAFERSFTPDDLSAIEARMTELSAQDLPVHRQVMARDDAIRFFRDLGEHYKAEIIASIPQGDALSLYGQGDFVDLCRGPHVPSTGRLKAFKLMKIAGAYWRGDSSNEMLQRIYGTSWATKKDLDDYLHRLEEAEKRDHRKLGRQLDLFHFQEEAPGMVFWHGKGWTLYQIVERYIREVCYADYQEVHTPQVLDRSLWERSGHWDKFHDMIFATQSENREYAIKPMNCPRADF